MMWIGGVFDGDSYTGDYKDEKQHGYGVSSRLMTTATLVTGKMAKSMATV